MENCKICGKEFKSAMSLANHIRLTHKISCQEYYDRYFKIITDGICENCGKPTKFVNIITGYKKVCSIKCAMPGRAKRNIEKYGYSSNFSNPNINVLSHSDSANEKRRKTMLKKYGVDTYTKTNDFKQKSIEYKKAHKNEIKEKQKQTMLEKYGVEHIFQTESCKLRSQQATNTPEVKAKVKQTTLERYGVECVFNLPEVQEKAQRNSRTKEALRKRTISRQVHINEISYKSEQTKRKNGNKSKLELYFEQLCIDHNIEFISEYYTDKRYPFLCDYYLPKTDQFIEIFGGWFHNDHLYGTDINDNIVLEKWKEKAKSSKAYKYAIDIWSNKDLQKVKCATDNKLNFTILWSKDDINKFFD